MKIGSIASLAKADIEGNSERTAELLHAEALATGQQIGEIEWDLQHGRGDDYDDPPYLNRELNLRVFRALDVLWRLDDSHCSGPIVSMGSDSDRIAGEASRTLKIPRVANPLVLDRFILPRDSSDDDSYGTLGRARLGLRTRLGTAGIIGWNQQTGPQRKLLPDESEINTLDDIARNQLEIGTVSAILSSLGYDPAMALFHSVKKPKQA